MAELRLFFLRPVIGTDNLHEARRWCDFAGLIKLAPLYSSGKTRVRSSKETGVLPSKEEADFCTSGVGSLALRETHLCSSNLGELASPEGVDAGLSNFVEIPLEKADLPSLGDAKPFFSARMEFPSAKNAVNAALAGAGAFGSKIDDAPLSIGVDVVSSKTAKPSSSGDGRSPPTAWKLKSRSSGKPAPDAWMLSRGAAGIQINSLVLTFFIICTSLVLAGCQLFKVEDPDLKEGIELYEKAEWAASELAFERSLEKEPSEEAQLGRGLSLYRQGKHSEASDDFRRLSGSRDDDLKARAYFNLGNSQVRGGDLNSAIESFRRSLEFRPRDHNARYNLEWALWMKEQAKNQDQDAQSSEPSSDDPPEDGEEGESEKDEQEQAKDSGEGEEQSEGEGEQEPDSESESEKDDDSEGEQESGGSDEQGEEQAENNQDEGEQNEQDEGQGSDEDSSDPSQEEEGESTGQDHVADGQESDPEQSQSPSSAQRPESSPQEQQETAAAPQQGDGQEQEARQMNRQEVSEILDALSAGEQNVPLWRFQEGERSRMRGSRDKDW